MKKQPPVKFVATQPHRPRSSSRSLSRSPPSRSFSGSGSTSGSGSRSRPISRASHPPRPRGSQSRSQSRSRSYSRSNSLARPVYTSRSPASRGYSSGSFSGKQRPRNSRSRSISRSRSQSQRSFSRSPIRRRNSPARNLPHSGSGSPFSRSRSRTRSSRGSPRRFSPSPRNSRSPSERRFSRSVSRSKSSRSRSFSGPPVRRFPNGRERPQPRSTSRSKSGSNSRSRSRYSRSMSRSRSPVAGRRSRNSPSSSRSRSPSLQKIALQGKAPSFPRNSPAASPKVPSIARNSPAASPKAPSPGVVRPPSTPAPPIPPRQQMAPPTLIGLDLPPLPAPRVPPRQQMPPPTPVGIPLPLPKRNAPPAPTPLAATATASAGANDRDSSTSSVVVHAGSNSKLKTKLRRGRGNISRSASRSRSRSSRSRSRSRSKSGRRNIKMSRSRSRGRSTSTDSRFLQRFQQKKGGSGSIGFRSRSRGRSRSNVSRSPSLRSWRSGSRGRSVQSRSVRSRSFRSRSLGSRSRSPMSKSPSRSWVSGSGSGSRSWRDRSRGRSFQSISPQRRGSFVSWDSRYGASPWGSRYGGSWDSRYGASFYSRTWDGRSRSRSWRSASWDYDGRRREISRTPSREKFAAYVKRISGTPEKTPVNEPTTKQEEATTDTKEQVESEQWALKPSGYKPPKYSKGTGFGFQPIQPMNVPLGGWLRYFFASLFCIPMSFAALSIVWFKMHEVWSNIPAAIAHAIAIASAVVLLITLITFALRVFLFPRIVWGELFHHMKGNYYTTPGITLLLLSVASSNADLRNLAIVLWTISAAVHLPLTIFLVGRWFTAPRTKLTDCSPTCFLPVVGNFMLAYAGGSVDILHITWLFYSAGVFFWLVLSTIFFVNLLQSRLGSRALIPVIFLLMAPAALGGVAYNSIEGPEAFFKFCVFFSFFMLLLLGRLTLLWIRAPFTPNWWTLVFSVQTVAIAAGDWALYVMQANDSAISASASSSVSAADGITIEHVDEVSAQIWLCITLVISVVAAGALSSWTLMNALGHTLFVIDTPAVPAEEDNDYTNTNISKV
ncbi:C4-dicarboxylate ABC transporter [Pelomyxa schiedti]|nr:C4-dicarboxylate ABC transporter [Pelomyxa schiedti]